jgi:hypothetical protein
MPEPVVELRKQDVIELGKMLKDEVERPNGCPISNFDRYKEDIQRVLDELQACIVLAGGRKFPIKELGKMPLAEAMFLCFPNHIRIRAYQTRLDSSVPSAIWWER